MKTRTCLILTGALLLCMTLVACNFVGRTKQQLDAVKAMWLSVQDETAALESQGRLPAGGWDKFVVIDEKFRTTHRAAVVALEAYEAVSNAASKDRLIVLLARIPEIVLEAYRLYEAWKLPIPDALKTMTGE